MDDEAGLTTIGNARTRGINSSMADRACSFPESDDPKFAGSMISLMTIEEEGTKVTLPWFFCRYSSQSSLDPIDIAL